MAVSSFCRHALLCAGGVCALAAFAPAQAEPGVAGAVRVGTPGYGLELDVGLGERFAARLGYSYWISTTPSTTRMCAMTAS